MPITVSELIVRFLERLGVTHVFGMPGAHILPVYDRLFHSSSIATVLAKHEQGAAFMAGGLARAGGGVGACIATAGPGATNLITGIANAYADRLPVLAITGETSTHIFGKGGLQESSGEAGAIDQSALFGSITRYHRLIERTDYLGSVLTQAAKALLAPEPGPVLLAIPYNVQNEAVEEGILDEIDLAPPPVSAGCGPEPVERLAEALAAARRPAILAGYGVIRAGARGELETLAAHCDIPVATSLKGKGAIAENHPLALGTLGVTSYGPAYRRVVEEADLLLILGAGLNERTSYAWKHRLTAAKRVIQIDHDYRQLSKTARADIAIQGDLRTLLAALNARLRAEPARPHVGASLPSADAPEFGRRFHLVAALLAQLRETVREPLAIFDDNIIFAQNLFPVLGEDRYYPNTGISALGHAIPAAIGSRFHLARPTLAILGDGGFQMCCMELMTAVNYGIPLTVLLFNNATLGLIRKNQAQQYGDRYIACDFVNPDYRRLAAALGFSHLAIRDEADIAPVLAALDLAEGRTIVEVFIDKDTFPNYSSQR